MPKSTPARARAIEASRTTLTALCALALAASGCAHGRPPASRAASWSPAGAPGAPARVETFRAASRHTPASAWLVLPGTRAPQLVNYDVVDGVAVMDGDIVLGNASTLAMRNAFPLMFGAGGSDPDRKYSSAVSNRSQLWPNAEIPYELDGSVSALGADIQSAIEQVNGAGLRVRPRTAADKDYVVFIDPGDGGCSAELGRVGGRQQINLAPACRGGSVIHEIMHAAGFLHEHCRADRDAYVTIKWDAIEPSKTRWFEKRAANELDAGPYDYASIMHYGSEFFSQSGQPTIVPHVANAPIGQRENLSDLDRAGIAALYGQGGGPTPPVSIPSGGTPTTVPGLGQLGLPALPFPLPVPQSLPVPPVAWPATPATLPFPFGQ